MNFTLASPWTKEEIWPIWAEGEGWRDGERGEGKGVSEGGREGGRE